MKYFKILDPSVGVIYKVLSTHNQLGNKWIACVRHDGYYRSFKVQDFDKAVEYGLIVNSNKEEFLQFDNSRYKRLTIKPVHNIKYITDARINNYFLNSVSSSSNDYGY